MKASFSLKELLLVFLAPIAFFVVALLTLRDYGINWDDSKHFIRGQSYLHFILTGKHDFLDLPAYPPPKGAPDYVDQKAEGLTNANSVNRKVENFNARRSYFQSDFYTFDYFITKHVHTHPEVNDLLVAFSNYIFFQKLGVIGDIEAYHLFIVFVTFALLVAVSLWVYRNWGLFASFIAASSLVLYPLVFSESHFNVKDPVLMSFFGLAILAFWFGFSKSKPIYILLSALFAGFALGTKFNTLFLPFILGPWFLFTLFIRYRERDKRKFRLVNLVEGWKVFIAILTYPFIALGVLYLFSPYLWGEPVGRFMGIVNYYKDIGTGTLPELSGYLVGGWNTYPFVWIAYTTPLPILFLSLLGMFYCIFLVLRKQDATAFLVLLWFTMPIVRAVWPGMNVYGGVRQIMEFVPAMAILAGVGAFFLVRKMSVVIAPRRIWISRLTAISIIASLAFVVFELVRIHPNQNIYFNQLVGGLKGAREKRVPSWGNTFGNVYLQGIKWLNENAGQDAILALPVNYVSSIPRLKLRQDIDLDNHYFSGPNREGEYGMEMDFDWPLKSRYKYSYYETFLEPVYQVVVDGVPLLKIWKNDLEHTKKGYEQEVVIKPLSVALEDSKIPPGVTQQKLRVDFAKEVFLTRLIIEHSTAGCEKQGEDGFVAVSQDMQNWVTEPGPLTDPESPEQYIGMDENTFVYMFPARLTRSVIFNSQQSQSCVLKNYKVTVMGW